MTDSPSENPYAPPEAFNPRALRGGAGGAVLDRFHAVWRTPCILITVFVGVMITARVVTIGCGLWYRTEFGRALEGEVMDRELGDRVTYVVGVVGVGVIVCWFGLMVCGIVWAYKSHANVRQLGYTPRWSHSSTIWGFLIPCVNVLLVPMILSDLVAGSGGPRRGRHRALVTVWWVMLLAGFVIDVVSRRMLARRQGLEDVQTALDVGLFGEGLAVVSWIAVLIFIRGASAAQREGRVAWAERRAERRAAAAAASNDGD